MNTLVTIPFSHFCEKARWALDLGRRHGLANLAYTEQGHLPLFSRRAAKRHGGRQVPVLATPGETLRDSTDILLWVDRQLPEAHALYPKDPGERTRVLALEDELDRRLGPDVRRVAYFHLLQDKRAMALFFDRAPVPAHETRLLELAPLRAALVMLMRKGLGLTPERSARSTERIFATLADLERRLSEAPFLSGDRFGAADLTFAALAGPMLLPPEYPLGWPAREALPRPLVELVERVEASPAGQHVRACYARFR